MSRYRDMLNSCTPDSFGMTDSSEPRANVSAGRTATRPTRHMALAATGVDNLEYSRIINSHITDKDDENQ
jgi:hypothetical protein